MPRRNPDRRHTCFGLIVGLVLPSILSGCGWAPLYADIEAGPTDTELRAIRVAPIAERIGQKLAIGLRDSLNPLNEPTPQRYTLRTTLLAQRADLGVVEQG